MDLKTPQNNSTTQLNLNDEKKEIKDLDYVFKNYVGAFGFWQVMVVILSCLSTPSTTMLPLFVNSLPKVRCNMGKELENFFITMNYTFEQIHKLTGPSASGCSRWNIDTITDYYAISNSTSTTTCIYGYIYKDKDDLYPGSIVKEWNLVCDKSPLVPLGTNIYMLGTVIGLLSSGALGDRFGRKRTVTIMGLIELICSFIVAVSPNYIVFVIFRCIVAGCSIGRMIVLIVISVEITNSRYRSIIVSTWSILQFSLSQALLSLEAYLIPNWKILIAVHNIPCFLVLLYFPLLPESPRWLLSQDRVDDLIKIFKRGKKINSIFGAPREPMTDEALSDILYQYHSDQVPDYDKVSDKSSKSVKARLKNFLNGFLILYKTRRLCTISIISTLVLTNETFVYFGIMLAARHLKQAVYLICFVNALMCVPATVFVAIVYRVVSSRKKPIIGSYIIAIILIGIGTTYEMVLQPVSDIVLIICLNISLIFLSSALYMLYIYISELYPSEIRTRGNCFAVGLGRIGGSFCVFLNETYSISHGLPFAVYGGILLIQLILLFILPDTDGENMKDKVG